MARSGEKVVLHVTDNMQRLMDVEGNWVCRSILNSDPLLDSRKEYHYLVDYSNGSHDKMTAIVVAENITAHFDDENRQQMMFSEIIHNHQRVLSDAIPQCH